MTAEIIVLPVVRVERGEAAPVLHGGLADVLSFPLPPSARRRISLRRSMTSLLKEAEPV